MHDTLNVYGHGFQVKVLAALITDRSFTSQIYDILDSSYFESTSLKWLVEKTLFYFGEYRKLPTMDVYKVQITGISSELARSEAYRAITETWKEIDSNDLDFVKSTILEFCRNKELEKAILKSAELLQEGKYEEIKVVIDRAMKAGINEHMGMDYLADIDYRYEPEDEQPRIPTGWKVLDDLLGGGMPRGKLGIISMPSGYGKSFFLANVAAHALKMGFNVNYYTLELDDKYVARRIDACITGISLNNLDGNIDEIKKRLQRVKGRLTIKEYATKRASWMTVNTHIDKMELLGQKPDLVIVDDPELLKMPELRDQRKDEQVQELYEEMRGSGKEKGYALWVPSQSNRTGLQGKGPAGNESISSSYGKIFTADVVIFGDRRGKHKINNTALFNLAKNRFGPDGLILPAKFDTAHAKIEIYDEMSDRGSEIKKEDPDFEREMMAKKYMESMMNKNRKEPDNNGLF